MAFIGIKVAHEVGRLFRNLDVPGEAVPENDYHITLVCFEDSLPIKEVCKALTATLEVMEEQEPFSVKSDHITCFPKREDNPCPIIAKFESKELLKLNEKLKKALDDADVEYMKTFKDYKPHMTLAYADEEIEDIKIEPTAEFFVYEITLWAGDYGDDRLVVTFPLKGYVKKNSHLIQKTNLFAKLIGV